MHIPKELFDDGIVKPSDADIAKYGGVDRREFLRYAGLAGLGLLAAACGGHSPTQPTNDCRTTGCPSGQACVQENGAYNCKPNTSGKITVTGRVYDTDTSAALSQYRITLGSTSQDVNNGVYSLEVTPGTYRAKIENIGGDFLSPMEVSVGMMQAGNYDFDVLSSDATFQTFLSELLFAGNYGGLEPLRRWVTQPRFVIDASFPQQFIDDVIKDVIHNDVPLVSNGRLFSVSGMDSNIEVSGSMPPQNNRPKGVIYIYNGPRQVNGQSAGTPNALDNGFAEFSYRPNWLPSQNRAIASQEILQNLAFKGDSTAPGKTTPTLPTIFDDFIIMRGIDRPTTNDIKVGRYAFSREPGTHYPDTRP